MNIHTNTSIFSRTSLGIGSMIAVVFGTCFIVPKIADAAGNLNRLVPISSERKANPQNSLNDGYEPPNFGRPESAYGSGTR